MNEISNYQRKKSSLKNLDNTCLYAHGGVRICPCVRDGRETTYSLIFWTDNGHPPEGRWLYAALEEHWPKIKESMRKIGFIDVLVSKGDAMKAAGDFLGSI